MYVTKLTELSTESAVSFYEYGFTSYLQPSWMDISQNDITGHK